MDRRTYLATSLGAAAVGLSGCSSFTAAASVPRPVVPADRLESNGWAETADESGTIFSNDYGPVTVEGVQHTLRYEDAALRQRVADRTLGEVDTALAVFFATRIDFSPNLDNLPGGIGRAEIISEVRSSAREQFEQQMRSQGLTDIETTGTGSIDIDTGETADTDNIGAVFPFDGLAFDVTDTESVEIPATDVDIEAVLGVWHHGDFVIVSGGAYPATNFAQTTETELSEGISVSVDVDLGLEPERYREAVRSLVAGVE
jgi:hypothetical protein